MATFRYKGLPTAGMSTRDVKVPTTGGGYKVFADVEPSVTDIVTTDSVEVAFMQQYPGLFEEQ